MPSRLTSHGLGRGPTQAILDAGAVGAKWVRAGVPAGLPPGFVAIWRWVEPFDVVHNWMPSMTPEAAAERWIELQWPHIVHVPQSAYVEGPNEPTCKSVAQAEWLGRFELRRMKAMAERGWPRCCIFNFSTGSPSLPGHDVDGGAIWTALLPALAHARANGHLLGLHEYGYEWDGFNLGRYRKVYAWLPEGARPRLAITEWGADGAVGPWRDARYRARFGDPEQAYLAQMIAYDREFRRDPYGVMFTVYSEGDGGDRAWTPFDIAGTALPGLMAQYIAAQRGVVDDEGTGGDDMAYSVGQTVWTTASVSVYNAGGQKIDALDAFTRCVVTGGPASIAGQVRYPVDPEPAGKQSGYVTETALTAKEPQPPSAYTAAGKCKPLNHHTLPLMENPDTDSQLANINADEIPGVYMQYDSGARWARGRNWYRLTGLSVTGARYSPAGWIPCWWGNRDNTLEIYPSDGKPHPDCEQQVVDVPVPPPPPVEPPPPPPPVEPPPVTGTNLLVNGSFGDGWTTDAQSGNQTPNGWGLLITSNGQPNLWPTHLQQGNTIPSVAQVVPECVHKLPGQLPANEQAGQPRALLLPGQATVYKLFGKNAWSAALSQVVRGEPGRVARATVYLLGETPDKATVPSGLEPDHFRMAVWFENVQTSVTYAQARLRRDVVGNERAWNRFVIERQFPPDGMLLLALWFQQEWAGVVDFFVGPVRVEYVDAPPPVEPPPPGELPDISAELDALEAAANSVLDQVEAIRVKLRG